ncbi:hypothetical protein TNCT_654481 [Trichonephila clavata]|uniref:Uncharacterized protein n=1 Tax=Trichonephila clavata TaxID=2740835 RepID=A0A8X6KJA2_TRICU|nr:hypothetical protein TNCT_654481 [Trichonephila clavata]
MREHRKESIKYPGGIYLLLAVERIFGINDEEVDFYQGFFTDEGYLIKYYFYSEIQKKMNKLDIDKKVSSVSDENEETSFVLEKEED